MSESTSFNLEIKNYKSIDRLRLKEIGQRHARPRMLPG